VRIHGRFIACCYRRGCPAVTLCKAESCTTAAGFILRAVKRRQARYKPGAGDRVGAGTLIRPGPRACGTPADKFRGFETR
jgi:hypothetical protein